MSPVRYLNAINIKFGMESSDKKTTFNSTAYNIWVLSWRNIQYMVDKPRNTVYGYPIAVICLKSWKIGGDIPAVLLIDDEQMTLMMLKMGLGAYRYQVEIAASDEERIANLITIISISSSRIWICPVWTAGAWYAISENRGGTVSCRSIDW